MKTINITLKIQDSELNSFESWLRQQLEVVSVRVLPDTDNLYNSSEHFQKLVKAVKKAQNERDNYINKNN